MPGIVVMGPEDDGVGGKPDDEDNEENPIFSATLDEQRRVYGQNVLPHRALKSLLALMWMALKYKVLVSVLYDLQISSETQWCMRIGSLVNCGSHFTCFIINVYKVVVGNIALLEPGVIIPCDGIFLLGHNIKCGEFGATGESDATKKVLYKECLVLRNKA